MNNLDTIKTWLTQVQNKLETCNSTTEYAEWAKNFGQTLINDLIEIAKLIDDLEDPV